LNFSASFIIWTALANILISRSSPQSPSQSLELFERQKNSTNDWANQRKAPRANNPGNDLAAKIIESLKTLTALKVDSDVWCKIYVPVYHLHNIVKDKPSEARTLRTTGELYISAPYSTAAQAALIKSAIVEVEEVITYANLDAIDRMEDEGGGRRQLKNLLKGG